MPSPTRDEYSFGMLTSRRGDTFREGKNPFTGEVVRFYDSTATPEECIALAEVLLRHGIKYDADSVSYYGCIAGTHICIPNTDLTSGHFGGASIELVGQEISDQSLDAVLEMGRSAEMFFQDSCGEGPIAAPTSEVKERVQAFREEEILLVKTAKELRSWLVDHLGSRKVI